MNTNRTFKILRDVYHILSYASREEILAAARQPRNSPAMNTALEALAEEAHGSPKMGKRNDSVPPKQRPKSKRGDELERALLKSKALPDKPAVLSFARDVGIRLNVHPKDGYTRVLSKFATSVKNLEPDRRAEVIQRLRGSNLSEIEGWINVINQSKGK